MKIAPEVMAFLVDPDTFAAARESSRTYGAPKDCPVSLQLKLIGLGEMDLQRRGNIQSRVRQLGSRAIARSPELPQ